MLGREIEDIVGAIKEKHRSRCIISGDFVVLLWRTATTAVLSEWKRMCFPTQRPPHRAAAATTGTNSFVEMSISSHPAGH